MSVSVGDGLVIPGGNLATGRGARRCRNVRRRAGQEGHAARLSSDAAHNNGPKSLDEWLDAFGATYQIPVARLMQIAKEFGTHEYEVASTTRWAILKTVAKRRRAPRFSGNLAG